MDPARVADDQNEHPFILNTMAALGMRVSLSKGSRASNPNWIGVNLNLWTSEILKPMGECRLRPLKELRVVAGKNAWLGGVLPRARWTTSVTHAVLSQTLQEEQQEKAPTTRNRRGLFAVKRLELARQWLLKFRAAAKLRPMRRMSLKQSSFADTRVMADASPEALGGMLTINGKIIAAFFSTVEKKLADELRVECQTSSSQGVLEESCWPWGDGVKS